MSQAVTEDVIVAVRIASFYPLKDAAKTEIVSAVAEKMVELGRKHNFLVYRAYMERKIQKGEE